jgi:hypothetical protein
MFLAKGHQFSLPEEMLCNSTAAVFKTFLILNKSGNADPHSRADVRFEIIAALSAS